MKTYKTLVEKPRLVISYDEYTESPREWSNVGYFVTKQGNYNSPDGTDNIAYEAMIETAGEANNANDHIEQIKKWIHENTDEKVLDIFPVTRYEHSNISYSIGTGGGFDHSHCGFYIVTSKSVEGRAFSPAELKTLVEAELEAYTQWMNGEVYSFTLYDEDGDVEDACGGFYEIEYIREHLPDEWKDEDLQVYFTL